MDSRSVALTIYKLSRSVGLAWYEHALKGIATVNEDQIEILKAIEGSDSPGISIEIHCQGKSCSSHDINTGDAVDIKIKPPRGESLFYAKDLADLLNLSSIVNPPNDILIDTSEYVSWVDTRPMDESIRAYVKSVELMKCFLSLGVIDYATSGEAFIMTSSSKVSLKLTLDALTLSSSSKKILSGADLIFEKLEDDARKTDKISILKAVLINSLTSAKEEDRLNHFFSHCIEIAKIFSNNYELFISNFSFDTQIEKIMEQKREYGEKLHQILSNIQGQLLAIPVSLILAYGLMKTESESNAFLVNTSVLASVLVFSVIVVFLLLSQGMALSSIGEEIKSKRARLKTELPGLWKEIDPRFTSLDAHYRFNRFIIWVLYLVIFFGAYWMIYLYFQWTPI